MGGAGFVGTNLIKRLLKELVIADFLAQWAKVKKDTKKALVTLHKEFKLQK